MCFNLFFTLQESFHELISNVNDQRPLVIVLGEVSEKLGSWLPSELPQNVKIVILSSDPEVVGELKDRVSSKYSKTLPSVS